MINRNRLSDSSEMQRNIFTLYYAIFVMQTAIKKLCAHRWTILGAEWTGRVHIKLVTLIVQGGVGSGEGSSRKGKGVKERKREKQIREAKDRYSVISLMGMCLHALKFRENTGFH